MPRLSSLRQTPPLSPSLLLPHSAWPVDNCAHNAASDEHTTCAQGPATKWSRSRKVKIAALVGAAIALAFALTSGPAHAAGLKGTGLDDRTGVTELSVSASFTREVEEDTAWVRWTLETEAATPASAQRELAVKLGRLDTAVRTQALPVQSQTLSVATDPVYGKPDAAGRPRVVAWQGRAQLRMASPRSEDLLKFAARLTADVPGLRYAGAGFELSLEGRQAAERSLLAPAAAELKKRAQAAAQALGCAGVRLIRVDVGADGEASPTMAYAGRAAVSMMAQEAAAEPALPLTLWPGKQALSLTMRAQTEAQCPAP